MTKKKVPQLFGKILNHPDYKTIVDKLLDGESVRDVSKWIKEKYKRYPRHHINFMLLQKFRKTRLNVDADAINQLKKERLVDDDKWLIEGPVLEDGYKSLVESPKVLPPKVLKEETEDTETQILKSIPSYKNAIDKAKEYSVQIPEELKQIICLVKTKIEDYFNKADAGTLTVMQEQSLQRFIKMWGDSIEKWGKYVEKIPDVSVEHTVNIQVINDQLEVFKSAIQEVVSEFDPEVAIKFYDKLNRRLSGLSYRAPKDNNVSLTQLMKETSALTEAVIKEGEKD